MTGSRISNRALWRGRCLVPRRHPRVPLSTSQGFPCFHPPLRLPARFHTVSVRVLGFHAVVGGERQRRNWRPSHRQGTLSSTRYRGRVSSVSTLQPYFSSDGWTERRTERTRLRTCRRFAGKPVGVVTGSDRFLQRGNLICGGGAPPQPPPPHDGKTRVLSLRYLGPVQDCQPLATPL